MAARTEPAIRTKVAIASFFLTDTSLPSVAVGTRSSGGQDQWSNQPEPDDFEEDP
jgi:hypothetical protein